MFRSSSRQPVQVVAPAPPIVMHSQPIYIPAPKSSSHSNQPYTILVGSANGSRRAPIEIVVDQRSRHDDHAVKPVSTSHSTQRRHSISQYHQPSHGHPEQPKIIISSSSKHHRSTSSSSAPRSDMATYGGSVYGDSRSYVAPKGHSSSHDSHHSHRDEHHHGSHGHSDKREAPTSRHNSVSVPQHTRSRTYSASGDYLRPPATQSVKIPSSSPQKHTRFAALPQSVPTKPVALPPHYSSSAPIQVSSSYPTTTSVPRAPAHHRSSQSHDLTLYGARLRQPPHGWFNRRGDEYLVERGVIRKADATTKWNPVFNDYPEPGSGWMDHERRFIPESGGILKH